MKNVVIAGYLRTPFSRSKPREPEKDPFHSFTAEELLAKVIGPLLKRTGINNDEPEDFLVGCALGVNEQWTFGGRTPLLMAGLSTDIPARMIDMQCGSSMAAVHTAFLEIACGQKNIALACGMEHMTRVPVGPYLFDREHMTINRKLLKPNDNWDMATGLNMGLTAELLAEKNKYTREMLDIYAERSHKLAAHADESGFFAGELVPVKGHLPDGREHIVDRDMSIRPGTTAEELAQLKTVFKKDGVITAGNSSPLNSGAAAMVLMSEEEAQKRGIEPLARIVSTGSAGTRPELMGTGPVPASLKALANAGLSATDIDVWEINEAFSAVVLNAIDGLGLPPGAVNMNGGAISVGHPLGASGVRLIGTLARTLKDRKGKLGCATACIGGGQGIATVIEAI